MIMVIVIAALVAITIAAMSSRFAHDVKRTQYAVTDAQLRQLLVTAASAAAAHLETPAQQSRSLCESLEQRCAVVTIDVTADSPTRRTARVVATYKGRRMIQQITFIKRDGQWQPQSAELSGCARI